MSITACGCRGGHKGPRPDNCRCAKITTDTISLTGAVTNTTVLNKDGGIQCFLTSYYLTVENKLGVALCNAGFYLDTRTVCKAKCGPVVKPGACEPDCIQVLLSSVDASKGCPCSKTVAFNGSGQFLCLPLLKPGTTVFTVIMTNCNDCCEPCPQLPAIFSLKLKQCCTKDTSFVTSTIIGCQPQSIKFPKHSCCPKPKCEKKKCESSSSSSSSSSSTSESDE